MNLSNPTNATIAGTGIGTATINNDDAVPTLCDQQRAASSRERGGTTNFVFTVTLSTASGLPVTVDYATADGTATVRRPTTRRQSGTLTFTPGQTTKTITVVGRRRRLNEANETFTVVLSNPANATITTGTGTGTIRTTTSCCTLGRC